MNALANIDVLRHNSLDSAKKLWMENTFIFQQVNDPKQTAIVTKTWLLYHAPRRLETPPQSPDLHPIENLWMHLDTEVRKKNVTSKENLEEKLQEVWNSIDIEITKKLIDSMLRRLEAVLKANGLFTKLKEYQEVFNQWGNDGIIEEINPDEIDTKGLGVHYLPHRAVFKDNSTTKVRPVFDGFAKTKNSVSINDCLEKGPNLIEMIPAILNRFGWGEIGVISNIKQAFLQIALNEVDRDVLHFIWWREGDSHNTVYYRHCRVVFGISCSPFLLAAILNYVLDQAEEHVKSIAMKLKS
ncbi:transposable element Tcb2 transposase [Trichonephila clavipes]|nr:transposable element Tcb2 transposase [Trichonephila clavipes]